MLWDWLSRGVASLRLRLILLISIAILPLGVVAVMQTSAVVADAQALQNQALLSRTLRAVNTERALLRRAYGAAAGLASAVLVLGEGSPRCTEVMENFIAGTEPYSFAGFISADGVMRCGSTAEEIDFSASEGWTTFLADPRPTVAINRNGRATGQSVMIATVPARTPDGAFAGAASISLPHDLTDTMLATGSDSVQLALVDGTGAILSASTGIENTERFDVVDIQARLETLGADGTSFEVARADGTRKIGVLLPLIEDRIFVLGLWEGGFQDYAVPFLDTTAPVFPLLMWLAALFVALLAVDRLVLRHLRKMQSKMQTFTLDDPADGFVALDRPPEEIESIALTYNKLLAHILRDRQALEQSVAEKDVLLREVHHRVKNNLQLMASILNMQIRTVDDPTARAVLRRVQERVMSLSSIHKALYTDTTLATVRADRLLSEVVQAVTSVAQQARAGIDVSVKLDRAELDPDQAVPLALLTNELLTNALKYLGHPEDGPPHVAVRLAVDGQDMTLSVENSTGPAVIDQSGPEGTGLGRRLMDAFTMQLNGSLEIETQTDRHIVRMAFRAMDVADTAPPTHPHRDSPALAGAT